MFILDTVCLIGICEQLIYEVLVQNIAETDPLHVSKNKTAIIPTIIPGSNMLH